jgi:hypothetical protein
MNYLYMLVGDGAEWEDIVLYADEAEAIAASMKHKSIRVEIFKRDDGGAYRPTYNYYLAGNLILTNY